ncbi:MAG: serine/threonine-protein kinase [Myxococcota bacterium]|nr:serine/threonine-protein kinase [Myxococcota bacterium]
MRRPVPKLGTIESLMSDVSEELPVRFGPFLLLRSLGSGGMGTAYLASHPNWDGYLVVKRLHAQFMNDEIVFKRFIHEAKIATFVRHANVTPVVAMGTVGKEPFFATEYVFGIPLSVLLERIEQKKSEAMPYKLILRMSIALCNGLAAIHEALDVETGRPLELIHRDIGTRNILLGFDGSPRIIDLGLGKSVFSDWQTTAGFFAGSPDYMPPEQALGHSVDKRGDLYALAVTIWELLVGRKRIREATVALRIARAIEAQPEQLRRYRPEVSLDFEKCLQNCMQPSAEARPYDVTVLRQELEKELIRLNKSPTREEIKQWLDSSCAIILAKERRLLEQIEKHKLAHRNRDEDTHNTHYLVAQPIIFLPNHAAKQESELVKPSPWLKITTNASFGLQRIVRWWRQSSKQSRILLLGILSVIFSLCIMVAVVKTKRIQAVNVSQIKGREVSEPRQVPAIKNAKSNSAKTEKRKRAQRRKKKKAQRLSRRLSGSQLIERRSGLVRRIRTLRSRSFDVEWQKKLTKLSGKVSSSESVESLSQIDIELLRMEAEILR